MPWFPSYRGRVETGVRASSGAPNTTHALQDCSQSNEAQHAPPSISRWACEIATPPQRAGIRGGAARLSFPPSHPAAGEVRVRSSYRAVDGELLVSDVSRCLLSVREVGAFSCVSSERTVGAALSTHSLDPGGTGTGSGRSVEHLEAYALKFTTTDAAWHSAVALRRTIEAVDWSETVHRCVVSPAGSWWWSRWQTKADDDG